MPQNITKIKNYQQPYPTALQFKSSGRTSADMIIIQGAPSVRVSKEK